jgi:SAM-dependent methyltransferase
LKINNDKIGINTEIRSVHIKYKAQVMDSCKHEVCNLVDYVFEKKNGVNNKDFKVLDIGCGRGEILKRLHDKGYAVKGIDLDKKCVEMCNNFVYGNVAENFSFFNYFKKNGKNSFDVIIFNHVLEHFKNPIDVLKLAEKHTDFIVIAVPNPIRFHILFHAFNYYNYSNLGHVYSWDRSHFNNFITRVVGLDIVSWSTDRVMFSNLSGKLFKKLGLYGLLNENLFPKLFPYFSSSLIVLCKC